jgi:hypothetical protein
MDIIPSTRNSKENLNDFEENCCFFSRSRHQGFNLLLPDKAHKIAIRRL